MVSDESETAALKPFSEDRSAEAPIEHYIEVAGHHHVATFLKLTQSMPCSILLDGRQCGRGSTLGAIIPNLDGTWLLMPICAHCSKEMAVTDEAIAKLA